MFWMFSVPWCLNFSFYSDKGSKLSLAQKGKKPLTLPGPPTIPKLPDCSSTHMADITITQVHKEWMEITWRGFQVIGKETKEA